MPVNAIRLRNKSKRDFTDNADCACVLVPLLERNTLVLQNGIATCLCGAFLCSWVSYAWSSRQIPETENLLRLAPGIRETVRPKLVSTRSRARWATWTWLRNQVPLKNLTHTWLTGANHQDHWGQRLAPSKGCAGHSLQMHSQVLPAQIRAPAGFEVHYRGQLGCLPLTKPHPSRPWGEAPADSLAVPVPRGPGGASTGGLVFVPTRCALQGGGEPAREREWAQGCGWMPAQGAHDEQLEEGVCSRAERGRSGMGMWGGRGWGPGPWCAGKDTVPTESERGTLPPTHSKTFHF